MPKKTKKEKLLAMYHRKLRLLEDRQVVTPSVQVKTPTSMSKQTINKEVKTGIDKPSTQEYNQSNQYFFSDLKKSLLLIVFILGIEISLYAAKLIK